MDRNVVRILIMLISLFEALGKVSYLLIKQKLFNVAFLL